MEGENLVATLPDAVVLLGRGGYGDWPGAELDRMVAALRATGRYARVESAFIDSGTPHLPKVLEGLLEDGARRIVVAPVFVPVERSLREWLPKILRRWMKKHHVQEAEIVLTPALGDHPAIGDAVARLVADADAEGDPDVLAEAPERDVANQWLEIPPHRYHVLFCVGPRCATLGSQELWIRMRERLVERGLSGDSANPENGVMTVRTSCLNPCNLGPLMVVHPNNAWYGALNERAVDQIVDQHFACGQPVTAHLRPRTDRPSR
jgi:(2Fe-2S) ferredoxin